MWGDAGSDRGSLRRHSRGIGFGNCRVPAVDGRRCAESSGRRQKAIGTEEPRVRQATVASREGVFPKAVDDWRTIGEDGGIMAAE